jgi:cell division septation protein DedD
MERAAKAGLPAAAEALAVMRQPPALDPPVEVVTVQPPRPRPPAPVSAPGASAKSKPPAKGWLVQVGAFSSRANADRLWAQLKVRKAAPLAPKFRFDGRLTRLQVGPFDSAASADAFCRQLRQASRDCFRISPGSS